MARAEGLAEEQTVPLPEEVLEELRFLQSHLPAWSCVGLPLPPDTTDVSIYTDAGEFGYGGHAPDLSPP